LGVGRGTKDRTPEKYTDTKSWRRPRPTQGCSATKEEEEEEEEEEVSCSVPCGLVFLKYG
jgi:hypothetical protein